MMRGKIERERIRMGIRKRKGEGGILREKTVRERKCECVCERERERVRRRQ